MPEPWVRVRTTDLTEGDTRESTVEGLERRDFVEYAGASGDFNPIHYDEPFATAAGNSSVFAQGMLTAGIASTIVTDWFGVGAVEEFDTRFRARVFPGDTVTARATVVEIVTDGDRPRARLDLEVVTHDDDPVIAGNATVVLAPPE